jgi:hypothetical protein
MLTQKQQFTAWRDQLSLLVSGNALECIENNLAARDSAIVLKDENQFAVTETPLGGYESTQTGQKLLPADDGASSSLLEKEPQCVPETPMHVGDLESPQQISTMDEPSGPTDNSYLGGRYYDEDYSYVLGEFLLPDAQSGFYGTHCYQPSFQPESNLDNSEYRAENFHQDSLVGQEQFNAAVIETLTSGDDLVAEKRIVTIDSQRDSTVTTSLEVQNDGAYQSVLSNLLPGCTFAFMAPTVPVQGAEEELGFDFQSPKSEKALFGQLEWLPNDSQFAEVSLAQTDEAVSTDWCI